VCSFVMVESPKTGETLTGKYDGTLGGNYGNVITKFLHTSEREVMTASQIQDSISRYEGNMFLGSRLAIPFSGNPSFSPLNDTDNLTVEIPFQQRFHPRDRAEDQQVDITWWQKADEERFRETGLPGIMAIPWLPFFSNCRGYDSHIMIAKLFEDHPNCSRVAIQKTDYVADWWFVGSTGFSERPASDSCTMLESVSDDYNKLWRMRPPDGFPDDPAIDARR